MDEQRKPTHRAGLFGYHQSRSSEPAPEGGIDATKSTLPLLARMSRVDNPSFLLLADALPQIVWTADPDGYQDFFNRQWFTYTGLSESETYEGVSALHADDFPRYVQQWSEVLQQGQYYEAEYRFRRQDGLYRWHLVRGLPVRDEHGTIVKWFGTFTDIHEKRTQEEHAKEMRKELEKEVERRTAEIAVLAERDRIHLERLKTIIEFMPFAALACDENDTVLHKNKHFRKIFDMKEDIPSFLGRNLGEVLAHIAPILERPERELAAIRGHLHARTPFYERELYLKNGTILSGDYIPLFENNHYRGHLLVYRDITASKRSDTVKSEFVSLASHQLRTPMTTIRWSLNMLEHQLSPDQKKYLHVASQATRTMSSTISTLLSIAHVQSENLHISFRALPLARILEEARIEALGNETSVQRSIVLNCPPDLLVRTDPDLLRESLQILLNNALKYSAEDSKVILRAKQVHTHLRIQIMDKGVGIPTTDQSNIFQKFFRASNVLGKVPNGTGLGLYLCQLIVRALGGTVAFTSQEGKGTTFTVSLPAANSS